MSGHARRFLTTHNALRGIAALAVFAYHLQLEPSYRLPLGWAAPLIDRGYVWVDFFFMLSGYVLSMSYLDRLGRGSMADIGGFLRARVARIVPLHLFALTLLATLVLSFRPTTHQLGGAHFWSFVDDPSYRYLALQAVLLQIWDYPAALSWNIPSWSISAEMQVYLALPLVARLANTRPRLTTSVMLLASIVIYGLITITRPKLDILDPLAILRCLAGFLLGAALEQWSRRLRPTSEHRTSWLQACAIGGLVVTLMTSLHDVWTIPFFALLVASTAGDRGFLAGLLANRPFQRLGEISYSIYLLNFPILLIGDTTRALMLPDASDLLGVPAKIALCLVLTGVLTAVASATYRWIEAPSRRLLRTRNGGTVTAAASVAVVDPAP